MVDVVSDQTEISYAESTTGWAGDTFSLENEIFIQGANSVSCIQTANGINDAYFNKATGSWDISSSHLRLYLSSNIMPNTNNEANDGIQILAYDGTNTAYWTVGGSDTYGGGWRDFIVDPNNTPDSGTVTLTAVTRVGFRINTSTKPRNAVNGWYDNFRFGNGIECNSTTTEAISFTDIADEDELVANKYGILTVEEDVLFGKGKITLGNAAGSKNCNLVSSNEQIVFLDRPVDLDLYAIVGTQGTGNTDIDITGLYCKTNGNAAVLGTGGADFDFSATLNSFSLASSTFVQMGQLKFAQGTVDACSFNGCEATTITGTTAITNTTWASCDKVTLGTDATLTNCNFTTPPILGGALDIGDVDNLANISGCSFASGGTGHAIELTGAADTGTYTWDHDSSGYATTDGSTGNETIHITAASVGSDFTINVAAGKTKPSVRNSGAGSYTVVEAQTTFSFTVNPSITGYEWRLYEDSASSGVIGTVALDGEETATQDNQSYTYTYSSDTNAVLQIIASGYEESLTYFTLGANDLDLTINLQVEENT